MGMQQDNVMLQEKILQDNVMLQDNIQPSLDSKATPSPSWGGEMGAGCAPHPCAPQEEEAACAAAPRIKQSHK